MDLRTVAMGNARKYKTAQAMVADGLKEAILRGVVKGGEALRQEEIAEQFGVSRGPVREALRQLHAVGLVELHANRGAVVTALSLGEVAELTEIRVALETMATRIAVPRTGEEGLRGAEEVLARAEAAPDLETHWSELDREFHCALYAAADRPQLMIMLTKLRSKFERYLGATDLLATDHTQREQREHRELLELYRKGDVDRSVDLVERHIRYAGESAAAAISELRGKEPT